MAIRLNSKEAKAYCSRANAWCGKGEYDKAKAEADFAQAKKLGYNPNTAPGTMYSVGGPIVEPGRKLNLVCDVRDLPDWSKIEFYNGAEKLGKANAPGHTTLKGRTPDEVSLPKFHTG